MQRLVAVFFLISAAATTYGDIPQGQAGDGSSFGQCTERDRSDCVGGADFNHTWKACGKSAKGNASKTTRCLIRSYADLSEECASCFGNFVGCARSHCWTECWRNPDGIECEACSNAHCQADLISCSGIPADQLPLYLFDITARYF